MRRLIIAAVVAVTLIPVAAAADDDTIAHVSTLAGEGPWQIAERLCPHAPGPMFRELYAANPWLLEVATIFAGTELHYHPAACPAPPTTTEVTTSSTTTTSAAPTTTVTAATTTTVAPTSTTSSTSTTVTSAPSTTSAPVPTTATTAPSTSVAPSTSTTIPTPTEGFSASFATALDLNRFDFQLHTSSNGVPCSDNPDPSAGCVPLEPSFQGEHNLACQGPTTLRDIVGGQSTGPDVDGLVYHCAPGGSDTGHFMTVVDTSAVAILSFSPAQAFTDVNRVCWDQNVNNLGEGKWVNVHIVPEAVFQANGGAMHYVNGQGFGLDPSEITAPAGVLTVTTLRGSFQAWQGNGSGGSLLMWQGGPADMDSSPAPRYRHCVEDIDGPNLRFTVVRPTGEVQTFDRPGTMPDGPARVIFQDGSYNPDKHAGTGHLTWHWDNVVVD